MKSVIDPTNCDICLSVVRISVIACVILSALSVLLSVGAERDWPSLAGMLSVNGRECIESLSVAAVEAVDVFMPRLVACKCDRVVVVLVCLGLRWRVCLSKVGVPVCDVGRDVDGVAWLERRLRFAGGGPD